MSLTLIDELRQLEQSDLPQRTYLTDGDPDALDSRISAIVDLADIMLITNSGGCDWTNIEALRNAGFNVTAGERDSFGWLSGVIHTSKGRIVYG